jgi:hypothetical protein
MPRPTSGQALETRASTPLPTHAHLVHGCSRQPLHQQVTHEAYPSSPLRHTLHHTPSLCTTPTRCTVVPASLSTSGLLSSSTATPHPSAHPPPHPPHTQSVCQHTDAHLVHCGPCQPLHQQVTHEARVCLCCCPAVAQDKVALQAQVGGGYCCGTRMVGLDAADAAACRGWRGRGCRGGRYSTRWHSSALHSTVHV